MLLMLLLLLFLMFFFLYACSKALKKIAHPMFQWENVGVLMLNTTGNCRRHQGIPLNGTGNSAILTKKEEKQLLAQKLIIEAS